MNSKIIAAAGVAALAMSAFADEMDRPTGLKVGERLTLRPYVSLSFTYDSNIDSTRHGKTGSQWMVSPGIMADYIGDNWQLQAHAWYQYHAYNHYTSQLNQSSYGEQLAWSWANSLPNEKGWSAKFSEKFTQIAQDDDMSDHNGRGTGRDRWEVVANGVVERRLNQRVHMAVDASYYKLDYDNNVNKYARMYGWERVNAGGEVGYMASKWTDFIIAANYQWYWQDNDHYTNYRYYEGQRARGKKVNSESRGWTLMGGLATRATERLEYRLLGGYSHFKYGNGTKDMGGFTYQVSARWAIEDRLSLMLLGSSYYQPSETAYGSATKTYTLSAGLAKSLVRGKMSATADIAYRKEKTEYAEYGSDEYDNDVWTGRLGLNYTLNRFITMFGRIEYQFEDSDRRSYEYDRWRGTVGMRLTY